LAKWLYSFRLQASQDQRIVADNPFFIHTSLEEPGNEAHISAEQPEAEEQAWIPRTHEIEVGAKGPGEPKGKGTLEAHRQRGKVTGAIPPCAIHCENKKYCVDTAVLRQFSRKEIR
jgi:hypothetical protein